MYSRARDEGRVGRKHALHRRVAAYEVAGGSVRGLRGAFVVNAGGYLDPTIVEETSRDAQSWSAAAKAGSFVDPNVVAALSGHAPETLAWAKTFGVQYVTLDTPFPTSVQPRISPNGGGMALLDAFAPAFVARVAPFVTNTPRNRFSSPAMALSKASAGLVRATPRSKRGHAR